MSKSLWIALLAALSFADPGLQEIPEEGFRDSFGESFRPFALDLVRMDKDSPRRKEEDSRRFVHYLLACKKELGNLPDLGKDVVKRAQFQTFLNTKLVVKDPSTGKPAYLVDGKYTPVEVRFIKDERTLWVCDNPSVGSERDKCAFDGNFTIVRYRSSRPDVYWVGIERGKGNGYGVIGWSTNGASCFIDAGDDSSVLFEMLNRPTVDHAKAIQEAAHRLNFRGDNCLNCHAGTDPFLSTAYAKTAWDQLGVPRHRGEFEEGTYHFRVPDIEHTDLTRKTKGTIHLHNPDGSENLSCRRCHEITDNYRIMGSELGDARFGIEEDKLPEGFLRSTTRSMPQEYEHENIQQREALEALRKYIDEPEFVSKVKITTHSPLGCEKVIDFGPIVVKAVKEGAKMRLVWKMDHPVPVPKQDNVRFNIHAQFEVKKPDGEISRTAEADWAAVGVRKENASFPRTQWIFEHTLPENIQADTIRYSIEPVQFFPGTNCGVNRSPALPVDYLHELTAKTPGHGKTQGRH